LVKRNTPIEIIFCDIDKAAQNEQPYLFTLEEEIKKSRFFILVNFFIQIKNSVS
jgi:hypothetical protein